MSADNALAALYYLASLAPAHLRPRGLRRPRKPREQTDMDEFRASAYTWCVRDGIRTVARSGRFFATADAAELDALRAVPEAIECMANHAEAW